jgi:hypothetical protein
VGTVLRTRCVTTTHAADPIVRRAAAGPMVVADNASPAWRRICAPTACASSASPGAVTGSVARTLCVAAAVEAVAAITSAMTAPARPARLSATTASSTPSAAPQSGAAPSVGSVPAGCALPSISDAAKCLVAQGSSAPPARFAVIGTVPILGRHAPSTTTVATRRSAIVMPTEHVRIAGLRTPHARMAVSVVQVIVRTVAAGRPAAGSGHRSRARRRRWLGRHVRGDRRHRGALRRRARQRDTDLFTCRPTPVALIEYSVLYQMAAATNRGI